MLARMQGRIAFHDFQSLAQSRWDELLILCARIGYNP